MDESAVTKQALLLVSRRWFSMHRRRRTQDKHRASWVLTKLPDQSDAAGKLLKASTEAAEAGGMALLGGPAVAEAAETLATASGPVSQVDFKFKSSMAIRTASGRQRVEQTLAPALVTVDFQRPFSINGMLSSRYRGTGVVVDSTVGLLVVDRNTVPSALGDVWVTFGNAERLRGEVVFVHPLHNFVSWSSSHRLVDKYGRRFSNLLHFI